MWVLAGLLAFPLSARLPDSSVALFEQTFTKGDYSCRYSPGLSPDSLASHDGFRRLITKFGCKDTTFFMIHSHFWIIFSNFAFQ